MCIINNITANYLTYGWLVEINMARGTGWQGKDPRKTDSWSWWLREQDWLEGWLVWLGEDWLALKTNTV